MKRTWIFICGLALGIGISAAITIPVVMEREKRIEQEAAEAERAVGALIVSEMHSRAYSAFLLGTNRPPEEKLEQLVLDGLKVHKTTYEDLRSEGILGPLNGFKNEYDRVCETLKELEGNPTKPSTATE